MSQDQLGLFDTPPDRRQLRVAFAIVALLIAVLLLILPVRDVRLRRVDSFIPVVDAIMFVGELITATLLYAQASVFRSRALTALASGYFLTALLLIPHALTFPGAFAPNGLLGAGLNATGWLAVFRRAVFPVAILFYVFLRQADASRPPGTRRPAVGITVGALAAIAVAEALTLLATTGQYLLPSYFLNHTEVIYANAVGIGVLTTTLFVVATLVLFRKRSSVLDTWLLVALSGWLVQSVLVLILHGRFTAGWYCLYAITLFAHLVVLIALIAESNRLYARLALTTAAHVREREARLMSMDAVAAAISHEVGQPLSAVTTNAMAGLSWLNRPQPDVEMAIKSLRSTLDAGHLTFDVIQSVRAMFAKGQVTEFSLNDLVRETATLMGTELAGRKVSLQLALDEALPPIQADRVQLQRVLVNLFTNAIESLDVTLGRLRRIAIRSAPLNGEEVLLEVSDTGIGIAPEQMPQIFDAFFTTKPTGTGLGLSLCRTIVEEHGGHLWATQGEEHGATFHLQLPRMPTDYLEGAAA